MDTRVFDTPRAMGEGAAGEIAALIAGKPEATLCIAAGHTSLPVFKALLESGVDFSRAFFVSMDEWTGIAPDQPGSCTGFLKRNFLDRANFPPDHVALFDGRCASAREECARISAFIAARGGIDYLVLGIGMNGHLALNEPGSGFDSRAREVALSQTTLETAVKYFGGPTPAVKGITLGIADLMEAGRAALCVCGEHKADMVKRLLYGPVGDAFPASVIRTAPHAALLADRAAMKYVLEQERLQ